MCRVMTQIKASYTSLRQRHSSPSSRSLEAQYANRSTIHSRAAHPRIVDCQPRSSGSPGRAMLSSSVLTFLSIQTQACQLDTRLYLKVQLGAESVKAKARSSWGRADVWYTAESKRATQRSRSLVSNDGILCAKGVRGSPVVVQAHFSRRLDQFFGSRNGDEEEIIL